MPPPPINVPGVPYSVKAARTYEKALRRHVLNPLIKDARERIRDAGQSYSAIKQSFAHIPTSPSLAGLSQQQAQAQVKRLHKYHRSRFFRTMNHYLGVDVRPLAPDIGVASVLNPAIQANVDLIQSIPPRFHAQLKTDLLQLADDAPFDQKRITDLLRKNHGIAGYNARRIARDQTSKMVGKLNEARQRQVGVEEYVWRTSLDERVRSEHQNNEGRRFRWDQPPSTDHPGAAIQCRCRADAVVPRSDSLALKRRVQEAEQRQAARAAGALKPGRHVSLQGHPAKDPPGAG